MDTNTNLHNRIFSQLQSLFDSGVRQFQASPKALQAIHKLPSYNAGRVYFIKPHHTAPEYVPSLQDDIPFITIVAE